MLVDKRPRTQPPARDREISPELELTPLSKSGLPVVATPRDVVVSPARYFDENVLVLQRQRETLTLRDSNGRLYAGDITQWRIAAWIKGLICLLALALVVFVLELEIARCFRHVPALIERLLALRDGLPSP